MSVDALVAMILWAREKVGRVDELARYAVEVVRCRDREFRILRARAYARSQMAEAPRDFRLAHYPCGPFRQGGLLAFRGCLEVPR